ncbi:MAG: bacterial Ig-like domain-containing protein [Firmicutes bacterium]|nr:bacterial Ig-like domain-containing protein [Bacillota bacterium]
MKKFSKLIVLLLMFAALALAAAACGPTGFAFSPEDPPKLVYLEGQSLELSSGKLTVKYGSKTEEIDLSDPGVTITGYDRNKVGEQELTLTYKNKTFKFTVTVNQRLVVVGHTSEYFVGETFDRSKGYLFVKNFDGTQTADIPLTSSDVTIEFNSSASGKGQTATAKYQNFTGAFKVDVYDVVSAELTVPTKTTYDSHETVFNATGGYLTFTGAENKVKLIPLSSAEVTGLNPGAATIANRGDANALTQTLTAKYLGREFNFDIKVRFSDVSLIKLRASSHATEGLGGLNWTGSTQPTFTETQGGWAVEAMWLYYGLTTSNKNLITDAEKVVLMRPAAVHGLKQWKTAITSFEKTIVIYGDQKFITGESYNYAVDVCDMLTNEAHPANVAGKALAEIKSDFPGYTLYGSISVDGYLSEAYYVFDLLTVDERIDIKGVLTFGIGAYDMLKVVPSTWTPANLTSHADAIVAAYDFIVGNQYNDVRVIFDAVTRWRKAETGKADYFDIIYWYYLYSPRRPGLTQPQIDTALNTLKYICLPGPLEGLYSNIIQAMIEMEQISQPQLYDATIFMMSYITAWRLVDEIVAAASTNPLYVELFEKLGFTGFTLDLQGNEVEVGFDYLLDYIESYPGGLLFIAGALVDDDMFYEVWGMYVDIIAQYFADAEYPYSEKFAEEIDALLRTIVAMPPQWQFSFFASTNANYIAYCLQVEPILALDPGSSYLGIIIYNYYYDVLGDDGFEVFLSLIVAMEVYPLYLMDEFGLVVEDFYQFMDSNNINLVGAMVLYAGLSPADKAVFDQHLGFLYTKCVNYYNNCKNPPSVTLGTWAARFTELTTAFGHIDRAFDWMVTAINAGTTYPPYTAYLSAVAAAKRIAQKIINEAPADILEYYYTRTTHHSRLIFYCVDYYWFLNNYYGINSDEIFYFYWAFYTPDLESFLADAFNAIFHHRYTTITGQSVAADITKATAAMKSFRELEMMDKIIFLYILDYQYKDYRSGIFRVLSTVSGVTNNIIRIQNGNTSNPTFTGIAVTLFDFELAYIEYINSVQGAADRGRLTTARNALVNAYNSLTTGEKTFFDTYLGDMYHYYLDAYTDLGI